MEKELLYELIENYDLKAVKLGTEYEEMSFEEIEYIKAFVSGAVPIYVKIGGVDARNDMNKLLKIGVNGIIAPMVESAYALKNFVTALEELTNRFPFFIKKGINIETITAYNNFETIIGSSYFKKLDQVTLARSDFSKSIGYSADDEIVYSMLAEMASQLRNTNKVIIVGGTIHPENSVEIVERIAPDRIDTRMFVIGARNIEKIATGVKKCLILEKALYLKMKTLFSYREGFIEGLLKKINHRLRQLPNCHAHEKLVDRAIAF